MKNINITDEIDYKEKYHNLLDDYELTLDKSFILLERYKRLQNLHIALLGKNRMEIIKIKEKYKDEPPTHLDKISVYINENGKPEICAKFEINDENETLVIVDIIEVIERYIEE